MNQPEKAEPKFSGVQQQLLQLLSITPLQAFSAVKQPVSADAPVVAAAASTRLAVPGVADVTTEAAALSAALSAANQDVSAAGEALNEPSPMLVWQDADRQRPLVQDVLQALTWLGLPAHWQVAAAMTHSQNTDPQHSHSENNCHSEYSSSQHSNPLDILPADSRLPADSSLPADSRLQTGERQAIDCPPSNDQPGGWQLHADGLRSGVPEMLQTAEAKKALWRWLCQQAVVAAPQLPTTGSQES